MSQLLDLDAELAAGTEHAKREIRPRRDKPAAAELQRTLNDARRQASAPPPKAVAMLRRALKIVEDNPVSAAKAARLCLDAVEMAPDSAMANHALALCLERLGRLSKALQFYERAWKLDPTDPEIYMNLSTLAWQMDMLDAAEKFLRIYLQMVPNHTGATINLAGVLRDKGGFEASIELLRAAIYASPENYELWNSLGTTLLESGKPDEALTFYDESRRLKPDYARAHHNTAFAYELLGRPDKATHHFREALKTASNHKDIITMTHGLSQSLLAMGELEEGWDLYDSRLDPTHKNMCHVLVDAPMWDGRDLEAIRGKRLLWVGEQGLGDEILFLQLAKDLLEAIGPEGELRIVVERRLVDMIQKTLPEAKVGSHRTMEREGKLFRAVVGFEDAAPADFWTPFIQPARAFRHAIEDFPEEPILKPEASDLAHWRGELAKTGPGLKVGILWKSLKMDAKRSKHFSAFDQWKPVLKTPGADFINLQYGETATDIAYAKERFGVDIHTLDGIDLKNDLEQVTALAASCDLVIGPTNATTSLAGAAGARVWFVHPHANVWTHMGFGRSPWFASSRSFFGKDYADWAGIMNTVAEALDELARKEKAA
ncbi:tetratricopeptide repeat protein [Marinicauda sp. Alg238-R41]|uniref:tetratricopeptide repeat protein n=1 Tax=Marinicauda sp. Alg238-R41 TaxID=2993447 RepID=UPI0022E1A166|nr:tetratricopeptide repeat protein [Marinicauda sp. Alg238-R41]